MWNRAPQDSHLHLPSKDMSSSGLQTHGSEHAVRLALLEQDRHNLNRQVNMLIGQSISLDDRIRKLGHRVSKTEETTVRQGVALSKLESLPTRMDVMDSQRKQYRALLQYLAAAIILALAIAGKVPWDVFLKAAGK